MITTLSALLVLSAANPTVAIEIQSVGLSADREARVVQRLQQELALMGADVVKESPRVLRVDLLRVGPVLKVKTLLTDGDEVILKSLRRARQGTLLPPKLREILVPPAPAPAPVVVVEAPEPPVDVIELEPVAVEREDETDMGLVTGGSATLAVGALVSVGAGALGLHETMVLSDAGASRADKDRALLVGPASVGTAVAFGVISLVGSGILAAGL